MRDLTPLRVALYTRVSTKDQHCENQINVLTQWAARQGHQIVKVYTDAGISGSKRRDKRPGLDNALKGAARAEYDLLAAFAVDRLGRSIVDLLQTLESLHAAGVDLFIHTQAIDTRSPSGKMLFSVLGIISEFERAMLIERVNAGLARAKSQGKETGPADAYTCGRGPHSIIGDGRHVASRDREENRSITRERAARLEVKAKR